ncbi:MAG TPA: hypothetical protein VEC10_12140 [Steroidobacteraceae bacterium]|nr:hypothetical protein [Steroidobacteraceae bacterium]
MTATSVHTYFYFGTAVRYLQDARPGERIADDANGGRRIRTNLSVVFKTMAELNLTTSLRSEAAARLHEQLQHFMAAGDGDVLSDEQCSVLERNIDSLRTALESELRTMYAGAAAQPCADAPRLRDDPSALFAAQVYDALPRSAQLDISEAARCSACEAPTAAAFHLLRAVGAVLRGFYASTATWRRTADHTELFNRLSHMRMAFKDPCQHPDVMFGPDEVQQLWKLSVEAINRMAPALGSTAQADVHGALTTRV